MPVLGAGRAKKMIVGKLMFNYVFQFFQPIILIIGQAKNYFSFQQLPVLEINITPACGSGKALTPLNSAIEGVIKIMLTQAVNKFLKFSLCGYFAGIFL
ncbi:MAG: hypothetical protein M0021_04830 [Clostridia bacterium]|nr:hypothetical protein [Clostridia bacterium]